MKTIIIIIALLIILKNSGLEIDRINDDYYKIYLKLLFVEAEFSLSRNKS